MRRVFKEIDALWKRLKALEYKGTFAGGGMVPAVHSTDHIEGGDDELDVTTLGGFTGNPAHVLRADGTFGPALGTAGAGQWIPSPVGEGHMLLNAEGHPVLVWWEGP